ncbi:hypothetical protein ACFV20_32400 [Streptomyces sp. NPDC059696]|uniref:hypothetical protein n=1 Tax=Streptomyces sp. NPDC059696 TaxID=3346911 RepID=UPI0036988E15
MALLAVLIPPLMLAVVLFLGRYEELLLPQEDADRGQPAAVPSAGSVVASSPAPAGTPVTSR